MKRFFTLFLAVLVCVSLCVNIAFADVTLIANDKVPVGFPFFISGTNVVSAKSFSSSDIISVVKTYDQFVSYLSKTDGGVTFSPDGAYITTSGTSNYNGMVTFTSNIPMYLNHKYLVYSVGDSIPLILYSNYSGNVREFTSGSSLIYTCTHESNFTIRLKASNNVSYNGTFAVNVFDLTDFFGAGSEPSSVDEAISGFYKAGLSLPVSYGIDVLLSSVREVSYQPSSVFFDNDYELINISDGDVSGGVSQNLNQVVFSQSYTEEGDYLSTETYSLTSVIDNGDGTYTISGKLDGASYNMRNLGGQQTFRTDSLGNITWTPVNINSVTVDPDLTFSNVRVTSSVGDSTGTITGTSSEDGSIEVTGTGTITGSGSISGQVNFGRLKLKKNKINFSDNNLMSGAFSANLVLSFGSQADFDSFNGGFYFNFETPAYNFSVPVKAQLLGANDSAFTKFYKIDVNNSFTGTYSKWTLGVYGSPSAIDWYSDVINYDTLYHVDSLDGLAKAEHSFFSDLWAKIKGLFNDRDKAMSDSVPPESAVLNEEVSSGAETIHEFETNNFDSIETQQENIDWDIPTDFGSSGDTGSAIGFVSMLFMGIYQALGVKVQYVIVVPLILGLVLLVLGRGSMALGKLVDSLKR